MVKHTVIFQLRATYEVEAGSARKAHDKAYLEFAEAIPDLVASEDGKVVCTDVQIEELFPITEVNQ